MTVPDVMSVLDQRPELQPDWLKARLAELVSIPSVTGRNPERAIVDHIEGLLASTGAETTVVEVEPGRPSLAAVLPGSDGSPRLVLNGHTDTVPPDDRSLWSVEPFGGLEREGAVWGRGAVDMKGGLVCQIACIHVLAGVPKRRGTLVAHFAMGEETGEPGTLALLEAGFGGDFGITTEPTGLRVAIAQRGCVTFRIVVHGLSAHAASPQTGHNPLRALPELLTALDRYGERVARRSHPLFAAATVTPTTLHAGVQHNAIADLLTLVVDRRLLPGETRDSTLAELSEVCAAALPPELGFEWEVKPNGNHYFEPAEIGPDSLFARQLLDHVEVVTGRRPSYTGTPYGSDVRNLINQAGIEAVTFGPGRVEDCHCPDEHLAIRELHHAARVIAGVACETLV